MKQYDFYCNHLGIMSIFELQRNQEIRDVAVLFEIIFISVLSLSFLDYKAISQKMQGDDY